MWSLGILLVIVLTGSMPFHARSEVELYKAILRANFQLAAGVSGLAKDLILRLLTKIPSKRLTAAQAAAHPWCTRPHAAEPPTATAAAVRPSSPRQSSIQQKDDDAKTAQSCYSEPWNSTTTVGSLLSHAVITFMCKDVLGLSYKWLKHDLVRDRRNPATATYWLLWQQLYGIRAATHARQRLREVQESRYGTRTAAHHHHDGNIVRHHRPLTSRSQGWEGKAAMSSSDDEEDDDGGSDDNVEASTVGSEHWMPTRPGARKGGASQHLANQKMARAVAAAAALTQNNVKPQRGAAVSAWMSSKPTSPPTLATQNPKMVSHRRNRPQSDSAFASNSAETKRRLVDESGGSAHDPAQALVPKFVSLAAAVGLTNKDERRPDSARTAPAKTLSPNGRQLYKDRKNRFAQLAAAAANGETSP